MMNKHYNTCYALLLSLLVISAPFCSFSQSYGDTNYYETSFLLKGGMVVIEAAVNGQRGNFILDTGSPQTVLNAQNKEATESYLNTYAFDGTSLVGNTKEVQLTIGNWKTSNKVAIIIDLSPVEQKLAIPIMGLIGIDVLKKFELHFNYQNTTITIYKLDNKGNRRQNISTIDPIDTIPFSFIGHLPCIKGLIENKEFTLGLDSGASINLFSLKYKNVINATAFSKPIKITGTGNQSLLQNRIFFKSAIKLGYNNTLPMTLLYQDMTKFNRKLKGKQVDGLLGFSFLSQQETAINFIKKEVYLWERKRLNPPTIIAQKGRN